MLMGIFFCVCFCVFAFLLFLLYHELAPTFHSSIFFVRSCFFFPPFFLFFFVFCLFSPHSFPVLAYRRFPCPSPVFGLWYIYVADLRETSLCHALHLTTVLTSELRRHSGPCKWRELARLGFFFLPFFSFQFSFLLCLGVPHTIDTRFFFPFFSCSFFVTPLFFFFTSLLVF